LHLIRSLKSKGKGAIILPHGVLFRGNVEVEIRKNIVRNGIIKGIIGLPANLFYGTGIPACIIVVDKENADNPKKGIFMIDASKGFVKDGNKNRLREQDIHKIVDVFNKQTEVPKYARTVPVAEIEQNEYNLNIPRYIDSQEPEDIQDIEAHLLGDIPRHDIDDLDKYWHVCPSLKNALFTKSSRDGYLKLKISEDEIKHTIFAHPEFVSYIQAVNTAFRYWQKVNAPILERVGIGTKPKEVIHHLSEGILLSFADINLVDKYDVYQHFMTYWLETMQDDAHLIAVDGWKAELSQGKGKKDEWDSDLLPKQLMINRYFAAEQKAIAQLEADCDATRHQKEAMEEEHSGEDGLLEEVKTDNGKISRGHVQKRIKDIKGDADAAEELEVLGAYLELMELEAGANKKIKDAQKAQDKKVIDRYKALTEDEVKTMVVGDKWLAAISHDVNTEVERISQRLTQRIKELAERYATPMPELNTNVGVLEAEVSKDLEKMGFGLYGRK
jgi:type I restriction enzyme M protein